MAGLKRKAGRRRGLMRVGSWALIGLANALLAAIFLSIFLTVEYGDHGFGGRAFWVRLEKQSVMAGWWDAMDPRTAGKVDSLFIGVVGGVEWVWVPRWNFVPPNRSVFVPLWIPLVIAGVAGAGTWKASRQPRRGICPDCGYDLSASPGAIGSRVCPECGNAESR